MLVKEKEWAKNWKSCRNCRSKRREHAGRGYCCACYKLVRKIEQVRTWEISDPASLKGFPREVLSFTQISSLFPCIKTACIDQLERHLEVLQMIENKSNRAVGGIDVEYQLEWIARKLPGRRRRISLYHGIADYIDGNFSSDQQRIIYNLLNRIRDRLRTRAIDWNAVWKRCL